MGMAKKTGFSVVAFRDGRSYSAWCSDLEVASQGRSLREAIAHLKEAMELHIECLTPDELREIAGRQGSRLIKTVKVALPAAPAWMLEACRMQIIRQ